MICSTSECVDALYKAAIGVGFPVASAKQSAIAAVWMQHSQALIGHGLGGFELMLRALDRGPCDLAKHVRLMPDEGKVAVEAGSIVDVGPCVVDAVTTGSGEQSAVLDEVAGGALLLGMLAGPSAPPLAGFDLDLTTGHSPPLDRIELTVGGGCVDKTVRLDGRTWTLVEPQRGAGPVEVDEGLWHRVCALAAATYVPSSDESRQGAGAGLTDND